MEDTSTLPVRQPAAVLVPAQSNPLRRILVVEEDDHIRSQNTEVLIRHGYHVDAAEDGAIAWKALKTGSYDLLITEHNVAKITGIELLKALRAARITLPIIMATGNLPKWEFTLNPRLEPAATLLKPYTTAELLGTVQAILRAHASPADQIVLPLSWPNRTPTDRLRP